MRNRVAQRLKSLMNRAIAQPSLPTAAIPEVACHAGGRGFESRRSRTKCLHAGGPLRGQAPASRRLRRLRGRETVDPGADAHPRDASACARLARVTGRAHVRAQATSDAEATDAPGCSDARSGGAGSPPSTRAPAPRAGLEEDPPPTSYPGGGCPSASRSARGVAASFAADGGSWLRRSREAQPQRRRQCSSPRRIHRRDCSCRPR